MKGAGKAFQLSSYKQDLDMSGKVMSICALGLKTRLTDGGLRRAYERAREARRLPGSSQPSGQQLVSQPNLQTISCPLVKRATKNASRSAPQIDFFGPESVLERHVFRDTIDKTAWLSGPLAVEQK